MRENPDKLRERSGVPAAPVVSVIRCVGDEANHIHQGGDDLLPHGVLLSPAFSSSCAWSSNELIVGFG